MVNTRIAQFDYEMKNQIIQAGDFDDNSQIEWDSASEYFGDFSTTYNYNRRGMISDGTKQGANTKKGRECPPLVM